MTDAPAYLRAFRAFIRDENLLSDVEELEQEFYADSDRAVGILQASAVEVQLEAALKGEMKATISKDVLSDIFAFNGPLGTFSSKILIGHGLGLFGKKTFHDLELIRELRNAFAHCGKPMKFATPVIANMCKHLLIPDIANVASIPQPIMPEHWPDVEEDLSKPKTRYLSACHTIAVHLHVRAHPHLAGQEFINITYPHLVTLP